MRLSDRGLALLKSFESCRLTAYQDSVGIWTIGYGSTENVQAGMVISQDTADELLEHEIESVESALNCMVDVATTSSQWDALVSLTFNIGSGNFKTSTVLSELNANAPLLAANAFMRFVFAGGEPSDGLWNRRKAERARFLDRS